MGTHGIPEGDTMFRNTLAITRNYVVHLPHPMLVAVPLALFGGLSIMNILLAGHYFVTLLAAPFTCLPPSISPYSLPASALKKEWPPLFDGPLEATSVRDFWSRRWHALFRRTFLAAGGQPGAAAGGYLGGFVDSAFAPKAGKSNISARKFGMRLGGVMGVFLASGLMHDWGVWGTGQGTEFRSITSYFLLQGVAVIAEEALNLTKAKGPTTKASQGLTNGIIVDGNVAVTHEEDHEPPSGASRYFMKGGN
ncbi:hypothetical protein FRC10_000784 [Ceratobasidium sp. 414]|nr:hypothetical protein FRC10_000784 [Ceratobasidium sp. 414]